MRYEDYPAQEPFSAIGAGYHACVLALGAGISGIDGAYGPDPYQGVAIYPAARPTGEALVLYHGGGWTNGYKEWMAFMAPPLNAGGVTVASVGYRLAPAHTFPVGFDDACRGLAWVHREITRHGGDPARLYVGGHSAGGHYASLMAVRRDWQAGFGLPGDVVRGCLPISGVYDFGERSGLAVRPRFLGDGENELAASPIRQIQGIPPAFLIAHGSADFPHLIRQADLMEKALRAAGGEATRLVLPECNHFQASYASGEAVGPWAPAALAWMKHH